MNNSELLILGDSFCSDRYKKSTWPKLVSSTLCNLSYDSVIVPRGCGYAGASWWSSRRELLDNLKLNTPKVAIFCHTEPNRLPSKDNYALNISTIEAKNIYKCDGKTFTNIKNKRLLAAASLYYEQLWTHEYSMWSVTQWFKELDELTQGIEKVLHFYSFSGDYTNYTFNNGITFADSLKTYAVSDKLSEGNHFTVVNNLKLAKLILRYVNNYPEKGTRVLDKIIND
tara:strand:- start:5467 stop:6147 length:681 start_codon:yes stop_codon:yes gene_type:complete